MRDQIEARMGQLREELQKADEELSKLRPRVSYLEHMILRLDGALTAMQGLLETPGPAQLHPDSPYGPERDHHRQPVAS